MITVEDLYSIAVDFLSEDGENAEYDRALADVVAECDPIKEMPLDERSGQVLVDLRQRRKERGW